MTEGSTLRELHIGLDENKQWSITNREALE